jgi:exonuclease III
MQRKRDMRFSTWNVRSPYKLGSLTTAARELARYKLDLVGIQEVRFEKGGTVRQRIIYFSTEKEMKINWKQYFMYITELYQRLRE